MQSTHCFRVTVLVSKHHAKYWYAASMTTVHRINYNRLRSRLAVFLYPLQLLKLPGVTKKLCPNISLSMGAPPFSAFLHHFIKFKTGCRGYSSTSSSLCPPLALPHRDTPIWSAITTGSGYIGGRMSVGIESRQTVPNTPAPPHAPHPPRHATPAPHPPPGPGDSREERRGMPPE